MEQAETMKPAPRKIGGCKVACYSPIDQRHRPTGGCTHIIYGAGPVGPAAGLAICYCEEEGAYYLFGCDAEWNSVTDSWFQGLDEAMRQAEFEYEGVSQTWQYYKPEPPT